MLLFSSSSSAKRLPGLDYLRSFAIIIVFFWHYRQKGSPVWVDEIGKFGWIGVDLFFVLSGYLICTQLLEQQEKYKTVSFSNFYYKRFFRIIPSYGAVLILYYTIPIFREKDTLPPFWKFATFTQNFNLDYRTGGAFSHAWSLCVEEQFYLLFPLILFILSSYKATPRAISFLLLNVFLLGFLSRYYSWIYFVKPLTLNDPNGDLGANYFKWVYYPTYNRLDGLLIGVSIALFKFFRPLLFDSVMRFSMLLFAVGLSILVCSYSVCQDLKSLGAAVFGYPMVSVGFGLIVLSILNWKSLESKGHKLASVIAILSFPIYLTHKQLIHLSDNILVNYGLKSEGNLMFIICMVVCVIGGFTLHLLVEDPFLRLRDRGVKRGRLKMTT